MKPVLSFTLALIAAIQLAACATPTFSPPAASAPPGMIMPGDKIGDMEVKNGRDESGEPSIFNYCSPIITESDPSIIVRDCTVPLMPYLFIGYGDFASSKEELDALWQNESWEMYFDGVPVSLVAFGTLEGDFDGNPLRQWNVAIENATPGLHNLRYVIRVKDGSQEPRDATWRFTLGESTTSSTLVPTEEAITYPELTSTPSLGQHPFTSTKAHLNFLLYLPNDYGTDAQKQWPLILFLHGSGARGNNLDHLMVEDLPKQLKAQTDFPFIVVSPQGNGDFEFWPKEEMVNSLFSLLAEIQAHFSVDPKRIYLTGSSAGGNGTWEIGLKYPDRFAALVPVMGYFGYPFTVPDNICDLKDVPIWAFHGAKDELVPLEAEEGLVNALKACGGNVQFTVYPDGAHDISGQVYTSADLYTWLLSQTLK